MNTSIRDFKQAIDREADDSKLIAAIELLMLF